MVYEKNHLCLNPYKLITYTYTVFKDFIDLKLFLYFLSFDQKCRQPLSLKCFILGHDAADKQVKWIKNLGWEKLSDGFEFKEVESICKRCRSKLILFQYPQWSNKIFSIIDCREKIISW